MKIEKYLMMPAMLLFAAVAFTSCGDDKDDPVVPSDSNAAKLIGSWVSRAEYESLTLEFNSNGSGSEIYEDEDGLESENFTWTATDTKLTISYEDGEDYTGNYLISNGGRTLTFDGEVFQKKK